jgi:hypothetical protein
MGQNIGPIPQPPLAKRPAESRLQRAPPGYPLQPLDQLGKQPAPPTLSMEQSREAVSDGIKAFAAADGVSEYSYEYWLNWKDKGGASQFWAGQLALHETLAEMARIK